MATLRQIVVLATGNPGKLAQFRQLLADCRFDIRPQSDYNLPAAEETGLTFVENAILKARHACAATGFPALADDSGLEVDALKGAPGIYSARYAGIGASDADNNRRLLEDLHGVSPENRTARYQCVLVYMRHAADPTPLICQAAWEGRILDAPRGAGGFGYDPLFFDPVAGVASAEMDSAEKHRLSHRGKAMRLLLQAMQAHD